MREAIVEGVVFVCSQWTEFLSTKSHVEEDNENGFDGPALAVLDIP